MKPRRTVGETLLLLVTGTICTSIMLTLIAVVIVEAVHPETDTSGAANAIGDLLTALTSLLAGFLAARTDLLQEREDRDGPGNPPG